MNWRIWLEVDGLLLERNIKPIIAVIPNNKEQAFFIENEKEDFWNYVRERQKTGWIIGFTDISIYALLEMEVY